jgi:quinoprotein glucose dehydrogenase
VPALLGGTTRFPKDSYTAPTSFRTVHRFAEQEYALNRVYEGAQASNALAMMKKLAQRVLARQFGGEVQRVDQLTSDELETTYRELTAFDEKLKLRGAVEERRYWQPLLDLDGLPGSKPPWGELAAVDVQSRRLLWQVPFGWEQVPGNSTRHAGSRNFGGVLTTRSNLVFATGTADEMARAYDGANGIELWSDKLPFAGSAQPTTYQYGNCQYVVFTATGGRFKGFRGSGDATVAYKLGSCR